MAERFALMALICVPTLLFILITFVKDMSKIPDIMYFFGSILIFGSLGTYYVLYGLKDKK